MIEAASLMADNGRRLRWLLLAAQVCKDVTAEKRHRLIHSARPLPPPDCSGLTNVLTYIRFSSLGNLDLQCYKGKRLVSSCVFSWTRELWDLFSRSGMLTTRKGTKVCADLRNIVVCHIECFESTKKKCGVPFHAEQPAAIHTVRRDRGDTPPSYA